MGLAGAWAARGGVSSSEGWFLTELSTPAGPPRTQATLTLYSVLSEHFPAAHLQHVFQSASCDVCLSSSPRSRERPEARPLQDACGILHSLDHCRGSKMVVGLKRIEFSQI